MQYTHSGVDTNKADNSIRRMVQHFSSIYENQKILIKNGYFANAVDIGNGIGIASCTDGVGSKTIIADILGRYDTIGIDCIAMNVNDLVCIGAKPISILDYIGVNKIDEDMLESIAIGLTEGARQSNSVIIGGEISQLPDVINGFDLVGSAMGIVDINKINTGSKVYPGDIIIGITSSGLHSNGYSFVRKILIDKLMFGDSIDGLNCTLGEELLKPTIIYVTEMLEIADIIGDMGAMVHITGDGLLNLNRIESTVGFNITNLPPAAPIFNIIQNYGNITDGEMYSTFNMGIGFCVIAPKNQVCAIMNILENHNRISWIIGEIIDDKNKTIYLRQKNLIGHRKNFVEIC